jgi:hypothetical protein
MHLGCRLGYSSADGGEWDMRPEDELHYHVRRAETELGLAREAASVPAARAHLTLAQLHRERLTALSLAADRSAA